MTVDYQARGAANRRKGHQAERDLARYLRAWFPEARRSVVTGSVISKDFGDLWGIPGVIWSVKSVKTERWPVWWAELADMRSHDPAALATIVTKRSGHSDVGSWYAHLRLDDFTNLVRGHHRAVDTEPVRITVACLVGLLIENGYAIPGGHS